MNTEPVIVCAAPARRGEAERLAADTALPLLGALPVTPGALALIFGEQRLELRLTGRGSPGPVYVDFGAGATGRRGRQASIRDEALARAAGLGRGWRPEIVDATAGLGRDSFILAALGCRVHAWERHPLIAALLRDGLDRAAREPALQATVARITLRQGDSSELLAGMQADVVLVDPMHPPRSKSAAVKKEMQILQHLLGQDENAPGLLASALSAARDRVVVKRPRHALPLTGPEPMHSVTGKSTRFDIYRGQATGPDDPVDRCTAGQSDNTQK